MNAAITTRLEWRLIIATDNLDAVREGGTGQVLTRTSRGVAVEADRGDQHRLGCDLTEDRIAGEGDSR